MIIITWSCILVCVFCVLRVDSSWKSWRNSLTSTSYAFTMPCSLSTSFCSSSSLYSSSWPSPSLWYVCLVEYLSYFVYISNTLFILYTPLHHYQPPSSLPIKTSCSKPSTTTTSPPPISPLPLSHLLTISINRMGRIGANWRDKWPIWWCVRCCWCTCIMRRPSDNSLACIS